MSQTFIVVRDCWRWALRDNQTGEIVAHSKSAFESDELAVKDLDGRRAQFPDANVEIRDRFDA